MSYVVNAIYSLIAMVPGCAARMHLRSGRMGARLRAIMACAGCVVAACGIGCGIGAYRGLSDARFGYFPAGAIALVAAFLLAGGIAAVGRATRNPAPSLTAANVIPFHRPVEFPAPDLHRYRRREE